MIHDSTHSAETRDASVAFVSLSASGFIGEIYGMYALAQGQARGSRKSTLRRRRRARSKRGIFDARRVLFREINGPVAATL